MTQRPVTLIRILKGRAQIRVEAAAYRISASNRNPDFGYLTGADLGSEGRCIRLAYEHSFDRVKGSNEFVGAKVKIAFAFEDLLHGKNPFSPACPKPVSPTEYVQGLLSKALSRQYPLERASASPQMTRGF